MYAYGRNMYVWNITETALILYGTTRYFSIKSCEFIVNMTHGSKTAQIFKFLNV